MSAPDVRSVLTSFLEELNDRLDNPHAVKETLSGDTTLSSADLGQRPETFTENYLIYELFDALGVEYEEQPYGEAGDRVVWPDFEILNVGVTVIGENKALNNISEAESEIKDYLDRKSIDAEYGIITDGIEWRIFKIELGGDITEYPEVASADLRPVLITLAREAGILGSAAVSEEPDIDEILTDFSDIFSPAELEPLLADTAPREIRDERKRDVEEFYELYIELLFGESDEYDYDTSLMDDIRSPPSATERDERLFAITLMNRLLFIKFLEIRGILDEGFLKERVSEYEKHQEKFAGNLYESQIKPLFYKLLNTPKPDREIKYRDDDTWFSDVEYLNGGLFRENIPNESDYTVVDRILPTVISDLIEGSELTHNGGGFDPRVLGSVFEKTINHIEQERTQKDIGAYYTPNDVTSLVIRRAVDPKIKSEVIDAFVDAAASDDDEAAFLRSNMEGKDLSEILRRIENGEGMYGTPEAIEAALDALSELKAIDPACGSGHFLTSAMDEIYRAEESLMRGLNRGDDPDPEERYEAKKDLALHSIYGVDVDPVATEIAKLRIWLKIVEGNSWEPAFGKLPNIDVNISDGNSLIGLPIKGVVESLDIWNEDIEEYASMREEYKYEDEGDRRDIEEFYQENIQPHVDAAFLDRLTHTVETDVTTVEEWDEIVDSIDDGALYPVVESIQVRRSDRAAFSEDETEQLDELGFSVYTKSARLDIQDREKTLKPRDLDDDVKTVLAGQLREILEDDFDFTEVNRQPLRIDIEESLGRPFHWPVEFPEVSAENGTEHTIHFDLILGNPPYGDIMSQSEKVLTDTYKTSGINDTAAQFVERQVQLLDEGGYFGNITTLRLVYQSDIHEVHAELRSSMDVTRIACFASRPQSVFENAEVRSAIITGAKTNPEGGGEIRTSEFLRFDGESRDRVFTHDIPYSSVEGLELGDCIGNPQDNYSIIPKVGPSEIEQSLEALKAASDVVFDDELLDEETEHVVWRKRHPRYWINPYLENLYPSGEKPQDFEPMYFDSDLKAKTVFCLMQSSLFYLYWTAYGNERDLNWGQLEAFPMPDEAAMEEPRDRIEHLSESLWDGMKRMFQEEGVIHAVEFKPLVNEIDELVGDLYDLETGEVEFLKNYHAEYGRGLDNDESASLDEFLDDDKYEANP